MPQRTAKDRGEDDGGTYVVDRWFYRPLTVEIVRGDVDRLLATSPQRSTPLGLRVGLARPDVQALLQSRGVRIDLVPDTPEVPACGAPDGYIVLYFGQNGRVRRLELQTNRS